MNRDAIISDSTNRNMLAAFIDEAKHFNKYPKLDGHIYRFHMNYEILCTMYACDEK